MKKKIMNIFIAVMVLLFTASFLIVTLFRKTGSKSYQENRTLTPLPEISFSSLFDGSYVKELGSCFSDYFAGRSYWTEAKATIDSRLCESIVNDVYVAEDMLLAVPDENIGALEDAAGKVNSFNESYDGAVYFVTVPSSSGVYSELLPEYFGGDTEKQQIDELYSQLSTDIRKIDAYNILKMLNENYIYYRNDSRWTSYGAYCVYRTVIQKLGFLPSAYDKYTIEHVSASFRGNLYNKTLYTDTKPDMLDIYTIDGGAEIVSCTGVCSDGTIVEKSLYDKSFIETNDMYSLYLGECVPVMHIETDVNNDRKLLVIKDSYADCFIPFLTEHYSEITVVAPECLEENLSELVDVNEYEQTLFLFGIESLT